MDEQKIALGNQETIEIQPSMIQYQETAPEQSQISSDTKVESIGAYDIIETIGSGGMGIVYKVKHRGASTTLALKMLRKELALDPINIKRFQQELKITSLLTHPNIVPITIAESPKTAAPTSSWNILMVLISTKSSEKRAILISIAFLTSFNKSAML